MVQMETQLQSIFEEVVVSERARDPGLRWVRGRLGAADYGTHRDNFSLISPLL